MSTRKKTTKSPHNSRLFSALFSGAFFSFRWSFLFLVFWINAGAFLGIVSSPWWKQRLVILSDPTSPLAHIQLAQMYWQAGQKTTAEHELDLARDIRVLDSHNNVLGLSVSNPETTFDWQKEPEQLLHAYTYWQTVIRERPDYRDAYIQLAYLAYLLRYDKESDQYIEQIANVDPTYSENLISLIGEK